MTSEYAASREDFELFRRFLRVARLLDANNFDELCSSLAPPTLYLCRLTWECRHPRNLGRIPLDPHRQCTTKYRWGSCQQSRR